MGHKHKSFFVWSQPNFPPLLTSLCAEWGWGRGRGGGGEGLEWWVGEEKRRKGSEGFVRLSKLCFTKLPPCLRISHLKKNYSQADKSNHATFIQEMQYACCCISWNWPFLWRVSGCPPNEPWKSESTRFVRVVFFTFSLEFWNCDNFWGKLKLLFWKHI